MSLERVEELLQRQPSIRDGNEPIAAEQQRRGRLEARGLRIRYEGAERDTLNGIDFCIEPGELVAVVGAVDAARQHSPVLSAEWCPFLTASCFWMEWMSTVLP